ncbi:MAG: RsmE family RNA methyltransferase [Acidimicrobiales bacterium]
MAGHPADHPGPFALVDDLDVPVLRADDAHHLERVLRVRAGDPLVLGDGRGGWRPARFGPSLELTGVVEHDVAPAPTVAVAFALVKGGKPELVVQKLTELGVDRIIPFRAARSVVQWDAEKAVKAAQRWEAVVRAAAMQSHRPWLPVVEPVTDLADVVGRTGASLADRGGGAPTLAHPLVLVGPEGGWAPEERAAADARGLPRVSLGPHVLRAETAALTAGALLTALRAGLAGPLS